MNEAFIRTEDINPKEVRDFFVETENDRDIIESLKGIQPFLLVGSRGTGNTMLLRSAEQELSNEFNKKVFCRYWLILQLVIYMTITTYLKF